ncbi:MAG: tRNA uridine-5-carboxymethylaminomethyl(34) synthesis GTPase MnmE [Verrucomicrobia bacterium]|nr:tRNA uridine-5-carboxymethylaminomethyl(34) synthesis GTPase MnmE [Verrucomicrobiota bacterium]
MEFVHRPYVPGETIAAVATPPGEGGIAIIRISGSEAIEVASKIFSGPVVRYESHTAHLGKVIGPDAQIIDEVLLLVMKGPRSFTGEDTVEIHCHGGALICRRVLEAIIAAGAKPALPGEFSFKAFLNGKIDLAQAEAIQAKIGARNEIALSCAEQQLEGLLSKKIAYFQNKLIDIAAILEAWVDFPEEDLEFASQNEVIETIEEAVAEMEKLIDGFHAGKMIQEGVSVCLVGSPNVGKSSLMNALLRKERAIVSPIPGTTRDLVEDDLRLNGFHLRLTDTAGIREGAEAIEEEGIRRSKKVIERSDIVLFVLDVTSTIPYDMLCDLPQDKTIAIWNKVDLAYERPLPELPFSRIVEVSAQQRIGLEKLETEIDQVIWKGGTPYRNEVVITSLRHKDALVQARDSCMNVIAALKRNDSAEFISFDMRQALSSLGTIIGTNITEDILTAVFSKFCIGK